MAITLPQKETKEQENKNAVNDILGAIAVMERALKKLEYNCEGPSKKISKKNKEKLNRLIKEYVKASVDYSWIGSKHPDDHNDIINAHTKTYKEMFNHIESI